MSDSECDDHIRRPYAYYDYDGHESEELFGASDDSLRSRSPRSPRTNKSPPRKPPGVSKRLTFSEPHTYRKTPAASRNVTPVSHGRDKTGRDGFQSVGHKVNQPSVRDRTDASSLSSGRNQTGQGQTPLGRHREYQPQAAESTDSTPTSRGRNQTGQGQTPLGRRREYQPQAAESTDSTPTSRTANKTARCGIPPVCLKENQPPAGESNDHLSYRSGGSVAGQSGSTHSEKEPQACDQSVLATILSEVKKTNSRLESFEQRLEKLEESVQTPSSSSSGATSDKYKRTVPTRVRGLVREVYKSLLEDEEDFDGFDLKKRYTDPDNQRVVKTLIVETKGQDCTISTTHVQDAARTFFQSKLQQESLKAKGKYTDKVAYQRRRNRLLKKVEERRAALERTSLVEDKKTKWREVLVPDFMSSEESGVEELEDDQSRTVFYVKPLPWRHPQVTKFFRQMDARVGKQKSRRSTDKMLPRYIGETSARIKPTNFPSNFWGYNMEK